VCFLHTSKASCKKHTGTADRLSLHSTPRLDLCAGQCKHSNESRDQLRTPHNVITRNCRYAHVSCARATFMCMRHVLPRAALASYRCSRARKIECHVILREPDYLFFALFRLPECASCHLFMCAWAQKPERFFHMLGCIPCTTCLILRFSSHRCLHNVGMDLCCVRLLYVAILCLCHALRLLLDSCSCLHACYPSRAIALSCVCCVYLVCLSGLLHRYMFNVHLNLVVI